MKKKTLLTLIAITMLSLAACGKTEETSGSNVNEPVQESQITESQPEPTETPAQESQEVTESTEAPVVEDAPVMEEKPYTLSEVIYPNGETPAEIIFEEFMNNGAYNNPAIIQPYYTLTNTSNSAYGIEIDDGISNEYYTDSNFEPGESIIVPAYLYQGDENLYGQEGLAYWLNADDSSTLLQYGHGVETRDANPAQNTIQEMITITFDESKVLYENVIGIDIELPENATETSNFYVIYYDAEGNAISSGIMSDYNFISFADKTFTYPALYYTTTNEPFVWATADVYYSYTINQ